MRWNNPHRHTCPADDCCSRQEKEETRRKALQWEQEEDLRLERIQRRADERVLLGACSYKQVIVMRTDLNIRKGKMAVQAGHAVQEALLDRAYASKSYLSGEQEISIELSAPAVVWG